MRWGRLLSATFLAGFILGALVRLVHELPGQWSVAGNLGGPWLAAAFVAGSLTASPRVRRPNPRWAVLEAAIAGLVTLAGMLAAYYATALLFQGAGERGRVLAFWSAVALVGGPLMGAAGGVWRTWPSPRRALAAGAFGGAMAGEAVGFVLLRPSTLAGFFVGGAAGPSAGIALAVEVAVGAAIAMALPRTLRERGLSLATFVLVAVVGAFAMTLLIDAFQRLA